MVDPTSVWGLDNDNEGNRRTNPSEISSQEETSSSFDDDDQSRISQIETNAFDDDDTDDIPFFRHRGEN